MKKNAPGLKKISFIVYFPYQWFIYRNIYEKIPPDQREVIVDLGAHPGLQDDTLKNEIVSLLEYEKVTYRVLDQIMYLSDLIFEDFFEEVEVIVSCWETGCVSDTRLEGVKKVCTTYGLAKELTMLRPSRSIYDVILAYGKRDEMYFNLLTRSIAIGNPRLDDFYKGKLNKSVQERLNAYFGGIEKKTVLYIPTHGDLGSFRQMLKTFDRLSDRYNIVFKPHYYTLREDKDIIERYRKIPSILIIDDSWDTIQVMAAVDVIVSDNSSSIFDSMQVDKPLVVCDFLDNEFLDVVHKNIRFLKGGIFGASTYSGSLEQEVKEKGFVMTIRHSDELDSVLDGIEETDRNFRAFRQKIVRDHFEYTDGNSAERATAVILDTYRNERRHTRGVLHHAYISYNDRMYHGAIDSRTSKLLSRSLPVISPDIVVWIVSERPYSQDETVGTLYSVLNERGVSCVCVSGIVDEASPSFLLEQGRFHQEIRFFRDHADGMDFINSRLVGDAVLLIVKANTKIRSLYKAVNFQVSCERDIVYFSENVISDRKKYSWPTIFYLFKREILGLDHFLAKETLLDVSKEQICSLEPCAVLVKGAVFSRHTFHLNEESSFLSVWFHLISIDFLKVENPRFSRKKVFMLMPNFFSNIYMSDHLELRRRFLSKGILLHSWGIPHKRWPERKITWYFFKIFSGNPQYCLLVYSFSLKTLILWKDILSAKIQVLERTLRSRP